MIHKSMGLQYEPSSEQEIAEERQRMIAERKAKEATEAKEAAGE